MKILLASLIALTPVSALAGGLLGGGLATSISRGKDRWWAIPLGVVSGAMIGCDIDGG